jgi:hypothetical protein
MLNTATAAVMLLTISACSPDTSRPDNSATIDTLPNGVIRVVNNGASAWGDTNGWKLVLERTIAPGEGDPGELNEPRDLVVDSHGNIYVADYQPTVIKVYDSSGKFLRTIGRQGSGPGEFQVAALLMVNDTLVVHDSRQTRTSTFTTDGKFIAVWPSFCCMGRPLLASHAGLVPIPGMIAPDTTAEAEGAMLSGHGVVWFGLDGVPHDTLLFPIEPEQPYWRMGDKENWSINSVPFQPGLLSRFGPDGLLYWGIQDAYRIIVSRSGRDTLRIIESQVDPVPLPDSLRHQAVAEQIEEDERWRAVAKLSDVPTMHPLWTSMMLDQTGNLWVLLPGPKSAGDYLEVFDPTGQLLGRVPAPFDALSRSWWGSDRVYRVAESEAGLPEIQVYRVERP